LSAAFISDRPMRPKPWIAIRAMTVLLLSVLKTAIDYRLSRVLAITRRDGCGDEQDCFGELPNLTFREAGRWLPKRRIKLPGRSGG
jgi:hypothetical protein